MDVHHNVAAGYLSTSRCESPDVVIHCGLCFRSSDCCAGSSFPKISMGSRIPGNCSTLQSGCTHCSFWKGRSLAEWDWSRSVPDGRNCAKSRTPPHSVIDYKPVATTQISLKHCQGRKTLVFHRVSRPERPHASLKFAVQRSGQASAAILYIYIVYVEIFSGWRRQVNGCNGMIWTSKLSVRVWRSKTFSPTKPWLL
jgi:hypothetical protein